MKQRIMFITIIVIFLCHLIFLKSVNAQKAGIRETSEKKMQPSYDYGNPVYGFAMAMLFEKEKIESGLPIWVTVKIKNISNKNLNLYLFDPSKQYLFTIYDSKHNLVPKLRYQLAKDNEFTAISASHQLTLKPGESITVRFNLSRRFDLSKADKYTVECKIKIASSKSTNGHVVATDLCSKQEDFEIIPSKEDGQVVPNTSDATSRKEVEPKQK